MSGATDAIGKVLADKYRIDGFLTQGGMGAVYRGTHVMLGRPVAIKLIKPELVTSQAIVERFLREARAASQLSHPNIVTVHDLGQSGDGSLYIAMELVEGESLKELIKRTGPLAPDRAVRLAGDICRALSLAHRNGVVHRDLKPQNVMVCADGQGGEIAKLLDFGIAKTFETDEPALTATGMVMGTPQYMSPEQAQGVQVDARADLYALGIIVYEMLGGQVPFRDTSVPALLVKHLKEPPPPLSRIRAGLPAGLEPVVLRCLEKEPGARFASADELARALETALASPASPPPPPAVAATAATDQATVLTSREQDRRSSATRPTSPAPPPAPGPPRPAGRGLAWAVAAGTALLLLLAGVTAAWWLLGRDEPAAVAEATLPEPAPAPEPSAVPASATGGAAEAAGAPSAGARVQAEPADTAAVTAAPAPSAARPVAQKPPATAGARRQPAEAQAPEPAPLPAAPPVAIGCRGVPDACAAIVYELESSFDREGVPVVTSAARAEIVLEVQADEVEARSEQQFGTTFVIRTYSVETRAEAPRFGERVPMPRPETFSFDTRFGKEKLSSQARLLAAGVTGKIGEYWTRKRGR